MDRLNPVFGIRWSLCTGRKLLIVPNSSWFQLLVSISNELFPITHQPSQFMSRTNFLVILGRSVMGIMAALFKHPDYFSSAHHKQTTLTPPSLATVISTSTVKFLFWYYALVSYTFTCSNASVDPESPAGLQPHSFMSDSWNGCDAPGEMSRRRLPPNYDAVEGRTKSWLTSGGFGTSNPVAQRV